MNDPKGCHNLADFTKDVIFEFKEILSLTWIVIYETRYTTNLVLNVNIDQYQYKYVKIKHCIFVIKTEKKTIQTYILNKNCDILNMNN